MCPFYAVKKRRRPRGRENVSQNGVVVFSGYTIFKCPGEFTARSGRFFQSLVCFNAELYSSSSGEIALMVLTVRAPHQDGIFHECHVWTSFLLSLEFHLT